jgi:prepilin peptidase CpaA
MREAASAISVVQPGLLAIAGVLLGIASLNDIATRTIPDLVPLALTAIGIATHLADGTATTAIAAGAAVFVAFGLCWRFGWLGGGDVKLLAACACLVPSALVLELVLLTALVGGVLATVYLIMSRLTWVSRIQIHSAPVRSLVGRIGRAERWRIRRRAGLPYACAIAIGTLLTLSIG